MQNSLKTKINNKDNIFFPCARQNEERVIMKIVVKNRFQQGRHLTHLEGRMRREGENANYGEKQG